MAEEQKKVEEEQIPGPGPEFSPEFVESLGFMYARFFEIIERRATSRNLPLPKECITPREFMKLDPSDVTDFEKIMDTSQKLIDFTEINRLRRKLTDKEMADVAKAVEEYPEDKDLYNAFMKALAIVKRGFRIQAIVGKFQAFLADKEAILALRDRQQQTIKYIGEKIEAAGFPVDGKKLARNYLNNYKKDPKKAYETLTTNPAFFAPININRKRKGLLKFVLGDKKPNPEEGRKINRDLANFLKKLKI